MVCEKFAAPCLCVCVCDVCLCVCCVCLCLCPRLTCPGCAAAARLRGRHALCPRPGRLQVYTPPHAHCLSLPNPSFHPPDLLALPPANPPTPTPASLPLTTLLSPSVPPSIRLPLSAPVSPLPFAPTPVPSPPGRKYNAGVWANTVRHALLAAARSPSAVFK
eukprot:3801238-Rhodomonas_salina.2